MPKPLIFTIEQLRADTGAIVRQAAASGRVVPIMDAGTEVAVIAHRSLVIASSRTRTILPDYEALMAEPIVNEVVTALGELRRER
jgi:hypothetical protein